MILGDCLEVMPTLPTQDVHLVFADLPFQRTDNFWDRAIDPAKLWPLMRALGCRNTAFALAATMPFAANLVASCPNLFRYDLVWTKTCATGFLNAKRMPMRAHESVLMFYDKRPVYNPQMIATTGALKKDVSSPFGRSGSWVPGAGVQASRTPWRDSGFRYPTSVVPCVSVKKSSSLHPTQKPAALLDWLIRTYSNEGDRVLDPVSGSNTTGVSAMLNGRSCLTIEKNKEYFEVGVERVKKTIKDNGIDAKVEVRT